MKLIRKLNVIAAFLLVLALCSSEVRAQIEQPPIATAQGLLTSSNNSYLQEFSLSEPTPLRLFYSQTTFSSKIVVIRQDEVAVFLDPGFVPTMEAPDGGTGYIGKLVPAGDYILLAYTTSSFVSTYVSSSLFVLDEDYFPPSIDFSAPDTLKLERTHALNQYQRATYSFTVSAHSKYSVYGVNSGIEFFILEADQEAAFLNGSQFFYLTDYRVPADDGIQFREVDLSPGNYVVALRAGARSYSTMVFSLRGYPTDYGTPTITSVSHGKFAPGEFRARVENLNPTKSYVLVRSTDLTFDAPVVVEGPRSPPGTISVFIDPSASMSQAFYRIEEVP